MALRNIVEEGDPILRKHARPVQEVTPRIREMLEDMLETLRANNGVGLAGPQIGVLRRIFVAEPEPDEVYYMVNPEILEKEGSEIGEEGCLSVPGYYGVVERPEHIRIRALDLDGNEQEYEFEGFAARVMCHEYDHLDGILYTDKATEVHPIPPADAGGETDEEGEASEEDAGTASGAEAGGNAPARTGGPSGSKSRKKSGGKSGKEEA